MQNDDAAAHPELSPAPAGKRWAYQVGYYCPRASGHFEHYADKEYDSCCGSKGWDLYLEASPGDSELPEGQWCLVPLQS